MTELQDIPWSADGTLEVLTFDLGGETFAIEAVVLREIVDPLPETLVPGAHPLVGSVVNFRGQVIPLADLRVGFGMERGEFGADSRIVVLEIAIDGEPLQVGIRTDRVNEVATLAAEAAEPPPALGLRWPRELVRALVRRAGDVVILPDLAAMIRPLLTEHVPPAAVAA
ncbi:MAG: chemotaxis protein CheW [Sphingomonadales bacterium]|nr:chemotaxis protein CheW [Sphingomonadales bacterium]